MPDTLGNFISIFSARMMAMACRSRMKGRYCRNMVRAAPVQVGWKLA